MKNPRYDFGKKSGAQTCRNCHIDIFNQWKKRSRHSTAKTSKTYLDFLQKFENNFMLNSMMGSQMCSSCHGPDKDGVDCETCHGSMDPAKDVMEEHKIKYLNSKHKVQSVDFCSKCHSIKNPVSGDYMVNTHNEWLKSPAGREKILCQHCHMKEDKKNIAYHGFDTLVRTPSLYKNKITLNNVQVNNNEISLTISNKVRGHFIPAGGPTRILNLRIKYMDSGDQILYTTNENFQRSFSLMFGLMPYKLLKDTRLRPSEIKQLSYEIPQSILERVSKVHLSLQFYEVSDEHRGNIDYAHWKSEELTSVTLLMK